ncbi:MAG TPA: TonB-dependent receptor, partial [Puia sp.]|nr:TonB-dependent receptor [Puia sp.]
MRFPLICLCLFSVSIATAQPNLLSGKVIDAQTNQPLEGVSVLLQPVRIPAMTNVQGRFQFKPPATAVTGVTISAIGYETRFIPMQNLANNKPVSLNARAIELNSVTVASHTEDPFKPIGKMDIALRGITNSQEVLRIVPGLFIGQHQGGGKAEQIFLRGFDCDHGTDISLNVDGLPINMVSHAHGQGFADSHFIIPETIGDTRFKKGPYYAEKGDFCTTGYVDFHTKDALTSNMVKTEAGMFNTYRVVALANLLGDRIKKSSWYAATEYRYSDGYFDNPQHFNRFNLFTKYTSQLSDNTTLSFSAGTLYSKWNASGQIPDRAVLEGIIGWFGALDPLEGGVTSRTNLNAQLSHTLPNGDLIKQQLYYTYYTFDLHTNFTFFLVDTVNGDEIRQKESRNLAGYKGSYEHIGYIGNSRLTTDAGIMIR